MAKTTVKRGGRSLTFNIGGGVRKGHGMNLHLGTMDLKLDKQYANMTMREIAEGLAKHFDFKRGEVEFINIEFAYRKEATK
jgi:hypothetical protein